MAKSECEDYLHRDAEGVKSNATCGDLRLSVVRLPSSRDPVCGADCEEGGLAKKEGTARRDAGRSRALKSCERRQFLLAVCVMASFCAWRCRMAAEVLSSRGVMETTMYSRSLSLISGTRRMSLSLPMRNWAISPIGKRTGCLSSFGRMRKMT